MKRGKEIEEPKIRFVTKNENLLKKKKDNEKRDKEQRGKKMNIDEQIKSEMVGKKKYIKWLVDWLILTARQPIWHVFFPRDSLRCLGHISAGCFVPNGSVGCGSALDIPLASGGRPPPAFNPPRRG